MKLVRGEVNFRDFVSIEAGSSDKISSVGQNSQTYNVKCSL